MNDTNDRCVVVELPCKWQLSYVCIYVQYICIYSICMCVCVCVCVCVCLCVCITAQQSGVRAWFWGWCQDLMAQRMNKNIFVLVWEEQVLPVKNNILIIQLALHSSLFKISEALLEPQ